MMDPQETAHFRHSLLERRKQILEIRGIADLEWQDLQQPEVEFEETAQKEKMAQGLDRLSDQELAEVQAIDAALHKMDEGTYGICESCGKPISVERLEAIPWTGLCTRCAKKQTGDHAMPSARRASTERSDLPPEYQDMSDAELQETIYDAIRTDGRIELEELDISCKRGIVYLEGALPSEAKHHMLLQIIEDDMALPNIIDHLKIDPLPWERTDRPPPEELSVQEDQEALRESEGDDEDVAADAYESRTTGAPFTPPDTLIPDESD